MENPDQVPSEDGLDTQALFNLYFDTIKLAIYTLYFGKQQYNDVKNFLKNYMTATFGDYFTLILNATISFLNITNYLFFSLLSYSYDVNKTLREDVYVNSYQLYKQYWFAQLYDSLLVLINMFNIIQFTTISRRVSLVFKLIALTAPYLGYLVLSYVIMLYLMAQVMWQVYGDKLSYFRYTQISMMYTLALFDLKSMYLGRDFMSANQFGVDNYWLLVLILLLAIVLHYSVTIQYSAYFHIYFNIAKKYEELLHTKPGKTKPGEYEHLRKKGGSSSVRNEWIAGIKKNPFADDEVKEEEEDE